MALLVQHSGAGAPATSHGLIQLVAGEGAGAHRHAHRLRAAEGPEAMRNLADAAHFLCILHGRRPGVVDHAADSEAALAPLADAFGPERAFVTRVAVASGPAPSTPGAAQAEQAVAGQVHALEMLALSERRGCAAGAAYALALDWRTLRPVLALVAARCGIAAPPCRLPEEDEVAALLGAYAGAERALMFGASQLLAQQRGLFDLLEARAEARRVADGF